MPVLEMVLEPGEALISTHGDLSWMTANMQLSQTANTGGGGGIMGGPEAHGRGRRPLADPLRGRPVARGW